MLRYANSFLWKLEKAANFKSQMEFLLRKPRTFENPISPSACNIFQVSLCIIVMMISLGHILYCLLHNSTPSPKIHLISQQGLNSISSLIWAGESDIVAASWQKLHKGSMWLETSSSNPLQRVLCRGPLLSLWSDSFWLTEFETAVSFPPFWESAKKEQSCSKYMQISKLQASGKKAVRDVRHYFLSSSIQLQCNFGCDLIFLSWSREWRS